MSATAGGKTIVHYLYVILIEKNMENVWKWKENEKKSYHFLGAARAYIN